MKKIFKVYLIIKSIIKAINNNPDLVKRVIYEVRYNGLRITIDKIRKKINSAIPHNSTKENIELNDIRKYFLLDEEKIPKLTTEKPIDIIIPIYNGFDYLLPLFNSIKNNTSIPYRLLVCNDKSTDKRVSPFLKSIKESYGINFLLIENSNINYL